MDSCDAHRKKPTIAWPSIAGLLALLPIAVFASPEQLTAALPLLQSLAWALVSVALIDVGGCEIPEVIRRARAGG